MNPDDANSRRVRRSSLFAVKFVGCWKEFCRKKEGTKIKNCKEKREDGTTVNAEYGAQRDLGVDGNREYRDRRGEPVRSRLFADNNTSVGITECPGLLVFCRCNRFHRNINRPMAR